MNPEFLHNIQSMAWFYLIGQFAITGIVVVIVAICLIKAFRKAGF